MYSLFKGKKATEIKIRMGQNVFAMGGPKLQWVEAPHC
jgi:hypothetical protein